MESKVAAGAKLDRVNHGSVDICLQFSMSGVIVEDVFIISPAVNFVRRQRDADLVQREVEMSSLRAISEDDYVNIV